MDCSEVSEALLQPFPKIEKDIYILSDDTISWLQNCNILVDENVFGSQSRRLEIAREFLYEMDHDTLSECLTLLEALISHENPPIQDIIDSGAVSAVLHSIEGNTSSNVIWSVRTLAALLKAGNEHQVAVILDRGILKHLDTLLSCFSYERTDPIVENIRHALKYIANISVNTREKLLNSEIIDTLSEYASYNEKDSDLLKAIFCNKDMPQINLNCLKIAEPTLANIFHCMDLSLVDFVISVLDTQIDRQKLSGHQSMSSYSSFAEPLWQFSFLPKNELPALKMLSRLSELDYFGSAAKTSSRDCSQTLMSISYKYLDSTSNETTRQACKSMGYLLRHLCADISVKSIINNDISVKKIIDAIMRLSREGGHLIAIHQRLLLYLLKQISSSTGSLEKCFEVQRQLRKMTFVELCSLLECDDSAAEIEAELKTFLATRTSIALEDQIRRCVECWAKEVMCEGKNVYQFSFYIRIALIFF